MRIALQLQQDNVIRLLVCVARRCSIFGLWCACGVLYATKGEFDSLFTLPGFLRKMAFSHAAPSPENRCFVRLGLARALLDSPPPGPCSHQYDRSKSGERVFSSISSV